MGPNREMTEILLTPADGLRALKDFDLVLLADLALSTLDEHALSVRESAQLWTNFVNHLADEAARRSAQIVELERLYAL